MRKKIFISSVIGQGKINYIINMKIFIASDHAGFELKKFLKESLIQDGYDVNDCGAHELVEGDDYPQYISKAAQAVSEAEIARRDGHADKNIAEEVRGVVIGGSGQGEAIVSNRYDAVRAAVYYGGPEDIIRLSRMHNDANVLSLGARFLSEGDALNAVKVWLSTPFSDDPKYERRIKEVEEMMKK